LDGSGSVAQELGKGLIKAGHLVMLGTRQKDKLSAWLESNEVAEGGEVGSAHDAATFGELIILATHGLSTPEVVKSIDRKVFDEKVVIDLTNPLDFAGGVPPKLVSGPDSSMGETIQKIIPQARVVKAFNTISAAIMVNPKREEGEPSLFIAGNDSDAKDSVSRIAKELGWVADNIIDLGDISKSYLLEALAMVWITHGFNNNHWSHAFKLLKK
jgi:8-hydroxy-5-deazaflavin:NADPH oxidoreductase